MNKSSAFQERIRSSRPSCCHGRRSISQLSQMYFSAVQQWSAVQLCTVLLCCSAVVLCCAGKGRSISQLSQMYFSTVLLCCVVLCCAVLLCCVVREKDRPPQPTAAVFWDWQPPVLDCWQTSESSELLSKLEPLVEGRSWSDGNGGGSDRSSRSSSGGSGNSGVRILFLHCCPNQLANYPGWETSEAVKFSKSNILPRQTPGTLD